MGRSEKKVRDTDATPSNTERLVTWIRTVRRKKLKCRLNHRHDLRIEAVLTCALVKAEHELRFKISSRISKLQQRKKQLLEEANSTNYERCDDKDRSQQKNLWKDLKLCPELSSFDNFMSKMSEIKTPLQR